MARNGFDTRELKKFRDNLVKLDKNMDSIIEDCARELAARLLREVKMRTPTGRPPKFKDMFGEKKKKTEKAEGEYGSGSTYEVGGGKIKRRGFKNERSFLTVEGAQYEKYWGGYSGGTLKRAWHSTSVVKHGYTFTILVINQTEYAIYVEYGHRQQAGRYVPAINKKLKKGWAPGKFMMTISAEKIQQKAPQIVEKIIAQRLGEYFID